MKIFLLFFDALIGYLLGSISPSILLSRAKGTDIRGLGSGNAGATNMLRSYGKGAALVVTVCDILKCVIAVYLARLLSTGFLPADRMEPWGEILAAAGCILGHNFPLYFHFRGGKGVLVSVTGVLLLDWRVGLLALLVFAVVFLISGFVSLGSICGALTAVLAAAVLSPVPVKLFAMGAGLLTIYRHKTNIQRLIQGTEARTTFQSKPKE